jgi:WD40 repeat protein
VLLPAASTVYRTKACHALTNPQHAGVRLVALAHSEVHGAASVTQNQSTIQLRDPYTLDVKAHLHGHLQPVTSLCMDADGGWLVSGSTDGTLKVWETDTGRCRLSQPCFRQGVAAVAVRSAKYVLRCRQIFARVRVD